MPPHIHCYFPVNITAAHEIVCREKEAPIQVLECAVYQIRVSFFHDNIMSRIQIPFARYTTRTDSKCCGMRRSYTIVE